MRRQSWYRAARIIIVVVILSFAWLQLALPSLPRDPESEESIENDPSSSMMNRAIPKFMNVNLQSPSEDTYLSPDEIIEIQEQITLRSQNETVINEELFGPVQSDTVVIVVQVHKRLSYLRHLIVSLAQARYINRVLLIFSHDYYDEDINKLVTTIDFCKVMQIFYPHSLQTHPTSYPGESSGDCSRDTPKAMAQKTSCVGQPDIYGHYREARYTQTKHHWWWKANKVFEHLWLLRNHTGLVMFLEEDHYVSEDFLHMLLLLEKAIAQTCSECSVITLGNYLKNYNFGVDSKKIELGKWISSKHNMGFAFNHSVWKQIKQCGSSFCNHDDYNWDWSLQHVSLTCLTKPLFTLTVRAPRVFHIGECGVHHKKKDCSPRVVLNKVYLTLAKAQKHVFPRQLVIVNSAAKKMKKHKGNGGWGDARDKELCSSFIEDTMPRNIVIDSLIPDPISVLLSSNNNTKKIA